MGRELVTDRDRRTDDIAFEYWVHVDLKEAFPPTASWRVEDLDEPGAFRP